MHQIKTTVKCCFIVDMVNREQWNDRVNEKPMSKHWNQQRECERECDTTSCMVTFYPQGVPFALSMRKEMKA